MTLRAVFFDQDVAAGVAAQLVADGFEAHVVRERFHGEDDEEDHPWAVVTEAPSFVVEVLVDRYDGWLEEAEVAAPPQPLDLPAAPRRIKSNVTDNDSSA
jgi:8-oxo-dGTP diphosphatase